MTGVLIRGDGIAARCCEHLLRKSGIPVSVERTGRPRLPVVLLTGSALQLIRDVFERQDLFRESPGITERVVAWMPGEPPVSLRHSSVVVSEQQLLGSLSGPSKPGSRDDSEWIIHCSRPPAASELHFGRLRAAAAQVTIREESNTTACFIESLESGWLFLIPKPDRTGWLLSVGGPPGVLLSESRYVGRQVEAVNGIAGEFPVHPRTLPALSGKQWLACGTAALAFDPICGDGTANSVREAILAAAGLVAIHKGEDPEALLRHYETRLTMGLQKHLLLCREFYASGQRGNWWHAELAALDEGLAWCAEKLGPRPEFRFQLNGFQLELRC